MNSQITICCVVAFPLYNTMHVPFMELQWLNFLLSRLLNIIFFLETHETKENLLLTYAGYS